jgi:hypothetical protein
VVPPRSSAAVVDQREQESTTTHVPSLPSAATSSYTLCGDGAITSAMPRSTIALVVRSARVATTVKGLAWGKLVAHNAVVTKADGAAAPVGSKSGGPDG